MQYLFPLLVVSTLLGLAPWSVQADVNDPLGYIQADKLRLAGLTGAGVKIGVISNGVQGLPGLQQEGVLPANITIVANGAGAGGEGVGMLQIVHQIAPDASLYFCANHGQDCTSALAASPYSVNIIVDDVQSSLDQKMEPTVGSQLEADDLAAHPSVLALHSAGNDAQNTYQAAFTPVMLTVGGKSIQAQDFGKSRGGASSPYDSTSIAVGNTAELCLYNSDDPSVPAPASNNEVGVWILDSAGAVLASASGNGAVNCARYKNSGSQTVAVKCVVGVIKQNNSNTEYFGLQSSLPLSITTPGAGEETFGGVADVISVAASGAGSVMDNFSQTGPYMVDWSATETGKDSLGDPILVYSRLPSPQYFQKPDLTGEDAWPIEPSQYFNYVVFNGTSAAAPSVAGVAALLMQAGLTRDQVVTNLEQTALPMSIDPFGNTITHSLAVWNPMDGYGLIQGYDALKYAGVAIPQPLITASSTSIDMGQSITFSGTCTVGAGKTITVYDWTFTGTSMSSSTKQNPGSLKFSTAGNYTATLNCTDSAGLSSGDPASMDISVTAPSTGGRSGRGTISGNSSTGGGGSENWLALVFIAFLVIYFKCHKYAPVRERPR
jgi:hypothetical protein